MPHVQGFLSVEDGHQVLFSQRSVSCIIQNMLRGAGADDQSNRHLLSFQRFVIVNNILEGHLK